MLDFIEAIQARIDAIIEARDFDAHPLATWDLRVEDMDPLPDNEPAAVRTAGRQG